MTYTLPIKLLCCTLLLALSAGLVSADADGAEEVTIVVSPNVVNLDSEGTWVTVHAEISYSLVAGLEVFLNDIAVNFTKSDARGELVAKFNIDDVKDILSEGEVDLTLSGSTHDGDDFIGTDTVMVIVPAGRR
jgi:hypothetical protein